MRIATWNVNSIRARVDRVVDWLVREDVDVLAMQETKCRDDQFPLQPFTDAGYEIAAHGLNQWNGVALASRLGIDEVHTTFDRAPGFGKPATDGTLPIEARALGATVNGVQVWSLYVPNGRQLDDPHYAYKLEWLARLAENARGWLHETPGELLALTGDWNVAPFDSDVGDPSFGPGSTHVSQPERSAFTEFERHGFTDVVRRFAPDGYTFWDYKRLRFPRDEGMRIDFIMGSPAFTKRVVNARIDRDERRGDGPSDHVPVVVDLAVDADDEDERPMIFG